MTNFPGVAPLANLGKRLGRFDDLDALLPGKQRDRGLANSAAVFDLMCIPLSGAQCIEDLDRLRQDKGLTRLLDSGSTWQKDSHTHPFLSPDGKTGFFNSDESGVLQAYMIRNLPA